MNTIMEIWRDEYYKKIGKKYKNHVGKFIDYLIKFNKANTPNNVEPSDFINSVGYYVKLGKINSRSSMEAHLSAIRSFYDYLRESGKDQDRFSQINYEEFKNRICDEYQLKEKVEREIFKIDMIKEMLNLLDQYFKVDYFSLSNKRFQEQYFHRLALRLYIKITLLAPAKRNIICNLKLIDFDKDFRYVVVNNIKINCTNSLKRDIETTLNIKKTICGVKINPDQSLFKYIIGENFSDADLNRWFYTFLKQNQITEIIDIEEDKDTCSIEPIMKTAIHNMVMKKVNPFLISKISGIKIGSLEKTYYSKIDNWEKESMSIDDEINFGIAKSGYYTYI